MKSNFFSQYLDKEEPQKAEEIEPLNMVPSEELGPFSK